MKLDFSPSKPRKQPFLAEIFKFHWGLPSHASPFPRPCQQ